MTGTDKEKIEVSQTVLQHIPKQAEVTRIEFEGPDLAIYVKKPEVLISQSSIISEIVASIRKRIVLRSDPSVRLPEPEAMRIIKEEVSKEAEITSINFDPSLGEVIIDAKKPGLVIGKNGTVLEEIIQKTKWRPRILRSSAIPSKIISHMRHYLHSESKERERMLRTVGERIFRPLTNEVGDVRISALGGMRQVGRSGILLRTRKSSSPRLWHKSWFNESLECVPTSRCARVRHRYVGRSHNKPCTP